MSNNALRRIARWVADCELWGVWSSIRGTKAASVLASIWGECAMAVMNMDVWKGGPLGAIRHLSRLVRCSPQYYCGYPSLQELEKETLQLQNIYR